MTSHRRVLKSRSSLLLLAALATAGTFVASGTRLRQSFAAGSRSHVRDLSSMVAAGPGDVAAGRTGLYLTKPATGQVMKLDAKGRVLATFGGTTRTLQIPRGVTVGKDGSVYVSESYGCRIDKFTPGLRLASRWEVCGMRSVGYDGPSLLATGPSGTIYATFRGSSRIEVFSPSGHALRWISTGGSRMEFGGIAVDRKGTIHLTELGTENILSISPDGHSSLWGRAVGTASPVWQPAGLALDAAGNVYVVDSGRQQVWKFDAGGHLATAWGNHGGVRVSQPSNISVAPDGTLYVSGARGLVKISPRGITVGSWTEQSSPSA